MTYIPATVWVRPILAVIAIATISYSVIVNVTVPPWYIVLATSIISFYFGHVNGKAEQNTAAAGEIATETLKRQISQTRKTDMADTYPKVAGSEG